MSELNLVPLWIIIKYCVAAIIVIFIVSSYIKLYDVYKKTKGKCLYFIKRQNLKYIDLECVVCSHSWRITRDRIIDE